MRVYARTHMYGCMRGRLVLRQVVGILDGFRLGLSKMHFVEDDRIGCNNNKKFSDSWNSIF